MNRPGLAKYADPARWVQRFRREVDRLRARRLRVLVEEQYAQHDDGPLGGGGPRVIVADGLWDNPNHWFRLRLFLKALPETPTCRLIGILRSRADKAQQSTLETLGFHEFVYIEEDQIRSGDFTEEAARFLAGIRRHDDILRIELPHGLPAYVYYDTVLKLNRHPRPPLDSELWVSTLAETLRNLAIYDALFEREEVMRLVVSHPCKSEYGVLNWAALCHGVPSYFLTAYSEGIRIRHFGSIDDYDTPHDHATYAEFAALPESVRQKVVADGEAYLAERLHGTSSDINTRYANLPKQRKLDRGAARRALGVSDDRPLAVIYAHAWFDFPHVFGMSNFTDYLDWTLFTVEQAKRNINVHWVFKPHPMEQWYGGERLADLIGDLPPHMSLCAMQTDTLTVQIASDAAVTVHGTVGIEAASRGVPTVCADRGYYGDWGFTHEASSREHYAELLATIHRLGVPTVEQRQRAMACFALRFAPAPEAAGLLHTRCDASGPVLYNDILGHLNGGQAALEAEVDTMRDWVASERPSYAVYARLRCHGRV